MISSQDLLAIGFLIFLEGILSIDNALVLALLARDLPPKLQKKALLYGLIGAVVFRLISLSIVTHLMRMTWVKYVGGGYLLFVGLKHLLKREQKNEDVKPAGHGNFWKTVLIIELTDIAFAVDSILAAVALTPKFWIVFTGGVLGVIMMRFAASVFLKILAKFPKFETTAYLLVVIIGTKLIVEALRLPGIDFHHASNPGFITFWGSMFACILYGFKRPKELKAADTSTEIKTESEPPKTL